MKKLVKRLLSGVLSLVTTGLIMAAPVAAVIYASQPAAIVDSFGIKDSTITYTDSGEANAMQQQGVLDKKTSNFHDLAQKN